MPMKTEMEDNELDYAMQIQRNADVEIMKDRCGDAMLSSERTILKFGEFLQILPNRKFYIPLSPFYN